jgi:hypothetical protein
MPEEPRCGNCQWWDLKSTKVPDVKACMNLAFYQYLFGDDAPDHINKKNAMYTNIDYVCQFHEPIV